jgi:hypothetical protein
VYRWTIVLFRAAGDARDVKLTWMPSADGLGEGRGRGC